MHTLKKPLSAALAGLVSIAMIAAPTFSLAEESPAGAPAAVAPISPADLHAALDQVQSLIRAQAQQLEAQRLQLNQQEHEIEELRARLSGAQPAESAAADVPDSELAARANSDAVSLSRSALALRASSSAPAPAAAGAVTNPAQSTPAVPEEGPLSLRLGRTKLTPSGWVDLTALYRSTDVGSGIGTSFASIPFNNTVAGALSETRLTAQSSRIAFRADEDFGKTRVFGYAEADFNGYLPSNGYVSTNSDTLRMRVYFLDVAHGKWEALTGQSWSLLTPNRVGVSPFLNEIYNTIHIDTNYQVGLTYARQAQVRALYHFNDKTVLAVSVENPEQFSGSAVTFPTLFSNTQTDVNSSTGSGGGTTTPNLFPDVIAKLATDPTVGDRRWHLEATGLLTSAAIDTPASITKTVSAKDNRIGAGISTSANLELVKGLHWITSAFWSDGGGRYIGGLGPSFVVAQGATTKSPFDVQLVHSGSGTTAVEWQATKTSLLSFTYSGAYFDRVSSVDPSTGSVVGYGYKGSAGSNNRAIQEATLGSLTTLWSHPSYGAIQLVSQTSYITRAPWYVASGSPKNAHVVAGFLDLRYVLP